MPDLALRFPVSTPGGRELLPGNAVLSGDVIREIAGSSPGGLHRDVPFLEYGTIRRDLLAYIRQDVYRHIFGETDERDRLLTGTS